MCAFFLDLSNNPPQQGWFAKSYSSNSVDSLKYLCRYEYRILDAKYIMMQKIWASFGESFPSMGEERIYVHIESSIWREKWQKGKVWEVVKRYFCTFDAIQLDYVCAPKKFYSPFTFKFIPYALLNYHVNTAYHLFIYNLAEGFVQYRPDI